MADLPKRSLYFVLQTESPTFLKHDLSTVGIRPAVSWRNRREGTGARNPVKWILNFVNKSVEGKVNLEMRYR